MNIYLLLLLPLCYCGIVVAFCAIFVSCVGGHTASSYTTDPRAQHCIVTVSVNNGLLSELPVWRFAEALLRYLVTSFVV